jgi:hypothetical protein
MSDFTRGGGTLLAGEGPDGAQSASETVYARTLSGLRDSLREEEPGVRLSAGGPLVPIESVKAILRAEIMGKCRLSRETKAKLAHLIRKSKRRDSTNHHMKKKARRRAGYFRTERSSKLKRDEWMRTTPEGSWFMKKYRTLAKGCSWEISREDWEELITRVRPDGRLIYQAPYILTRRDFSLGMTVENMLILDSETKEELL